jgi:prevent-host-death family protein
LPRRNLLHLSGFTAGVGDVATIRRQPWTSVAFKIFRYQLSYNNHMEATISQTKIHLSRLLDRVALGEEVVITKRGKPVAKLVPVHTLPECRSLGTAKGEFTVPDDFNDPLPKEIEDLFWN